MQEETLNRVSIEVHNQVLAEVADLKARLAWFERQMFGRKSERFVPVNSEQLMLAFEAEQMAVQAEQITQIIAAHERTKEVPANKHQGRMPIPADLPRVEEIILPEGDLTGMTLIGADITEVLEYETGRIWVRRTVRPRYVRSNEQQQAAEDQASSEGKNAPSPIIQAPAPDLAFPRLKAGISLLAHVTISKYVDHLPLHRIIGQLARQGIKIPDSTMGEWVKATCEHLLPLYKVYEAQFFKSTYLQMDETTLRVLEEGKGKTHLGYLWASFDPVNRLPFFFYQTGRDHKGPKKMLERFVGVLQCDGYSVYETLSRTLDDVQLVNCMSHIRRNFFEAKDNDEQRATQALAMIGLLYKIEGIARDQQLNATDRLLLRQQQAQPVFDLMTNWLQTNYNSVLPASAIGKALAYAIRRWDNMALYLTDGSIEIDNNLVENIIRPAAIGRKNYLFAGSHEAAQRTAMLYTFFSLCKHQGVNPDLWIKDVLGRIYLHPVNQLTQLLPHNWTPAPT